VELGTVTRGVEAVGANGQKGLARDILENFSKSCQARKVKLGKDPSRRGLTISESRVASIYSAEIIWRTNNSRAINLGSEGFLLV
jgi:hypothetical protein